MQRGKFIVLEGGDGTGKSACKEYLQEKLKGAKIIFTHEPGGTDIGQEIREILLKPRAGPFDPLTELLLFTASRAQHLIEKITPALTAGTHVICDRFAASNFAYQICASKRHDLEPIFFTIHELLFKIIKPDFYILLDLAPEIATARMSGRGAKSRLDAKELIYHARVRAGLLKYVKNWPHQIIDASQTLEKVREEVLHHVKKIIG